MDAILDMLFSRREHLIDRLAGPLNFRLVVMPIVVTILGILAERRDARKGRPARLGAFFVNPLERGRLSRAWLKDAGKVFLMAIVLDTVYQLIVIRWVYPGEVLFVAFACAIVPYVLVRGLIIRPVRQLMGRKGR